MADSLKNKYEQLYTCSIAFINLIHKTRSKSFLNLHDIHLYFEEIRKFTCSLLGVQIFHLLCKNKTHEEIYCRANGLIWAMKMMNNRYQDYLLLKTVKRSTDEHKKVYKNVK